MTKLYFAFCLFALTGCHLGPNYCVPCVETPEQWKATEQVALTPQVSCWWQVFEDETLNQLEASALRSSPSLQAAIERVVEARAIAGVQGADLSPQLSLDASGSNTTALVQTNRIQEITNRCAFDLSYQLDLWGLYRGQYKSAILHAQAEAEAYRVALLTLTADLAAAYYQIRALDGQIALLESAKNGRKGAYEVNLCRWQSGLANYTDVSRAQLEYTNAEAQYYDAIRRRSVQENQIALLTGTPASLLVIPPHPLEAPPPQIPANLPSFVLLNRPDIARAEREMASEHALIGAAYASFFPQMSLTGILGYCSPGLRDFLTWNSRLWLYGANALQTIFDGGRNRANLERVQARFNRAVATYRNQVLIAFREVEDALSNIECQALQYRSLERSIESAKLTTILCSDRYQHGLTNYLDVVDSERVELEVGQAAIDALGQRYLSTIQLIKALGGTWTTL